MAQRWSNTDSRCLIALVALGAVQTLGINLSTMFTGVAGSV